MAFALKSLYIGRHRSWVKGFLRQIYLSIPDLLKEIDIQLFLNDVTRLETYVFALRVPNSNRSIIFLHKIYKFRFMCTRFQRIQTPYHSTNT